MNLTVNITTEDGELLDRRTIEVPESLRRRPVFVAVRPVGFSMASREGEEILNAGVLER